MATYYCKCGRLEQKATNADNTGNRNTEGCEGCPYLLPWGPTKWDASRHAVVTDVKGYECRMSKDIEYATHLGGSVEDKCSCYISSLDFDFLEQVSRWINETYPNREIFGHFNRTSTRAVEYVCNGRYRMSICCAQNKKGIAAKAALLAQFFYPDGSRKDMTPEAEKALILERIAAGKAAAQAPKEETLERKQYQNEYGTVFAVREKDGMPRLMCLAKDAAEWVVSGVLAACTGDAKTADELQAVLDRVAKMKGWKKCETEANQPAPSGAAAATTAESAAAAEKAAETSTTSGSGADASTLTPAESPSASLSGQGCPADSAPASSGLSAAGAASLAAEPAPPAFDYDGLDRQTVADLHLAEREFIHGKRMAEMGLRRMADGVAIAHDALCGSCDNLSQLKHGNRGDKTFGAWCESVGLNRKAAERLLQVSALYDKSSPKQQKVLEQLAPSLLYAAAKPSAPAELVQGVKDGDITTHKQYQALLAEIHTRDAKIEALQAASEQAEAKARRSIEIKDAALETVKQAKAREEQARAAAHKYHTELEDVTAHRNALLDQQADHIEQQRAAEARAAEAEKARDGARQVAEAAKLRADKYKAENDALRAQAQAAPATVEARVIDTDEVERLADEKARALLAQWQAEQPQDEDAAHEAYDAVILAGRNVDSIWQMLEPHLHRLADDQRKIVLNEFLQKIMYIKEEVCKCL